MSLFTEIITVYPELTTNDFKSDGIIILCDDGDGVEYVAKWEYLKPIPEGLTLGK